MLSRETPFGRIVLLTSILLMVLGGLLLLVSVVGVTGLVIQDRFTWERANAAVIVILISAIVAGGGILLYRRVVRDPERGRAERERL